MPADPGEAQSGRPGRQLSRLTALPDVLFDGDELTGRTQQLDSVPAAIAGVT